MTDESYTVRLKDSELETFNRVFDQLSANDCRLTRAGLIRDALMAYCREHIETEDMLDAMAGEY